MKMPALLAKGNTGKTRNNCGDHITNQAPLQAIPEGSSVKLPGPEWKRLLLDKRISHGAFRLMHLLIDYNDPSKGDKRCFPGIRTLAGALGSNNATVSGWLLELKAFDWIDYVPQSRKRTHYKLLPEAVTDGPVTGTGNSLLPKAATASVTGSGNVTKPRYLNPITQPIKRKW